MTEEKIITEIEFKDEIILAEDWINEHPEAIQAEINTMIRTMVKASKKEITFMQVRKMALGDFFEVLKKFREKARIKSEYDFLAK